MKQTGKAPYQARAADEELIDEDSTVLFHRHAYKHKRIIPGIKIPAAPIKALRVSIYV